MRNLLLMLVIVCIVSCTHTETAKPAFDFYPALPDSIREKYLWRETKRSIFFNLPTMYNGADSFEIRIRPWDVFDLGSDLFVIKVNNMGWKGYHYNSYTLFHTSVRSPTDSFQVLFPDQHHIGDSVFMVKEFVPQCGWKRFADTLMSFNLDVLPTEDSIKNFLPVKALDGGGYTFQIATRHSYRLLFYILPELSSHPVCKTISGFMAFFRRQLGKDYQWPTNLKARK